MCSATKVSRGIFVTDSRLPGTDGNAVSVYNMYTVTLSLFMLHALCKYIQLSLVTLTHASLGGDIHSAIRVMQLDHASNNCPPGTCENIPHPVCV